ncbi:MAG: hypothetical protein IKF42_11545 [Mogibacterium sp.]|nr:hypothetical protein [Mogibacterium sp.]
MISKGKKIILSSCISIFLCICFLYLCSLQVSASTYNVVANGEVTVESGQTAEVPFELSSKKYVRTLAIPDSLANSSKVTSGKLEVSIVKNSGKVIKKYAPSLEGVRLGDDWWIYTSTDKAINKGQYLVRVKNTTNLPLEVDLTVRAYSRVASKASIKKKRSVVRGNWIKIGKISNGLPYYKSIKPGSKKIISDAYVDYNGNIYIYGKKAGKTTVTTTLKKGKRYTTTVTVKPQTPNVLAYLYDYNTRDNYFIVKVKNIGDRTVTVIRSGGKVENYKYKNFDRSFKSSSSVQIKPGKTRYVRFNCKGSTTWDDYTQYTVFAKMKVEGKTYQWHVWDSDSVIKIGKKWYGSYWSDNEEDYEWWNPNYESDDDDYDDEDEDDYEDEDEDYDDYY